GVEAQSDNPPDGVANNPPGGVADNPPDGVADNPPAVPTDVPLPTDAVAIPVAATSEVPVAVPDGATNRKFGGTQSGASNGSGGGATGTIALPVRSHQGCCSASDAADARFVAGMLDVPFYALNFKADFEHIIDYFVDEYVRGRTPNPCVVCNDRLKFGRIVDYADAVGARYIATGHYARIGERDGRRVLMRGVDDGKDQSYVLFGLDRTVLDRVMFPIGALEKKEVRAIAARWNLPNQDKPDSVEICFVPDRDYARVVRERRPDAFKDGPIIDAEGRELGRHNGIGHYTIGQRRGLGVSAPDPLYVTQLDAAANTVRVGNRDALLRAGLVAERAKFHVDPPSGPFRAEVQIRYLHKAVSATVHPMEDARFAVYFDEPQRAITPGQAVVLYDGDVVLGGGWIQCATDGHGDEVGDAVSVAPIAPRRDSRPARPRVEKA
ncbi:MAG: tRNA 2-thiouridine(34) synthase MnmA, partial [Planctomycetes bacterium]|nr:tRNA 2-thiouridine(34) synthase MnmA [Planctomycetota bacterium]